MCDTVGDISGIDSSIKTIDIFTDGSTDPHKPSGSDYNREGFSK